MPESQRPVDLNQIFSGSHYEVRITSEEPEERGARLHREAEEARHRRHVFWALFAVLIVVGVAVFPVALLTDNPDTRAWVQAVFSATLGGIAGYFGGNAARA